MSVALLDFAHMNDEIAELLLRVGDAEAHALGRKRAGVADLAAGFAIERRLVDQHRTFLAGFQFFCLGAVLDQRRDDALGFLGFVAEEFGGAQLLAQAEPDRLGGRFAGARPVLARFFALPLHRDFANASVSTAMLRGRERVLGEIERKAIGVVELERGFALELVAGLEALGRLVEDREPALERLAKARLLELAASR